MNKDTNYPPPNHTIKEYLVGEIFNLKHGLTSNFDYTSELEPVDTGVIINNTGPILVIRGPIEEVDREFAESAVDDFIKKGHNIISGVVSSDGKRLIISYRNLL